MNLYIIRHAYAHENGDPRWPDDSQRPLENNGAERFRSAVQLLAQRGFEPEVIATSPYVRCRQTADIVADSLAETPPVIELGALAPGSDLEAALAWSHKRAVQSLAWVGHAPDVSFMTAALVGDGDANVRFAKGAVAAIRFADGIRPRGGELAWLTSLKMLGV